MRKKNPCGNAPTRIFLLVWGKEQLSSMLGEVVVFPVKIILYFSDKGQVLFKWQLLPVAVNTGSVCGEHGNPSFQFQHGLVVGSKGDVCELQ